MLKMFKLQGLDASGHAIQTLAYRYGEREAHLAPDIRRLRCLRDRTTVTMMRARGLIVRASREAL